MRELISQATTTRDALNTSGQTQYDMTACEGGPSGYWLNPKNEEVDEIQLLVFEMDDTGTQDGDTGETGDGQTGGSCTTPGMMTHQAAVVSSLH